MANDKQITWSYFFTSPMRFFGAVGYLTGVVVLYFSFPPGAQKILLGISYLCIGISHTLAALAAPKSDPTKPTVASDGTSL